MIRLGEFEIARVEESVLDEATSLFSQWSDDSARQHPGHCGAPHCGYVRRGGNGYVLAPSPVSP